MAANWKLPDYRTISYTLNTTTNWYQLQSKPERFNKLPEELKVRPVMMPKMKEKAENLIEGHSVNKRKTFFTGLSTTYYQNLFFGDDGYNLPKKKSFILFLFSPDKTLLTCYFFNDYTPPGTLRKQFIDTFRQSLKENK
jgi:hypothetical protein